MANSSKQYGLGGHFNGPPRHLRSTNTLLSPNFKLENRHKINYGLPKHEVYYKIYSWNAPWMTVTGYTSTKGETIAYEGIIYKELGEIQDSVSGVWRNQRICEEVHRYKLQIGYLDNFFLESGKITFPWKWNIFSFWWPTVTNRNLLHPDQLAVHRRRHSGHMTSISTFKSVRGFKVPGRFGLLMFGLPGFQKSTCP